MGAALTPVLADPPNRIFSLRRDEEAPLWRSRFFVSEELPSEIRHVFERTGSGSRDTLTH